MLPESVHHKLIAEIELFIDYGVEQQDGAAAKMLVRKYQDSPQALAVLLEFYKVLPEAREEALTRIAYVDSLQGVTLLAVSTGRHDYLAVVSEGEVDILGEFGRMELPEEILTYFGHADSEAFEASCGPVASLPEFGVKDRPLGCPACQVAAGELHLLGCPVEICPWCDGQLSRCNCRFEKLQVESLDTDEQVEAFLELLEAKGRIAYEPEQKPAYPGTSQGLDR